MDVFLARHAIVAKPRTITELRWRLKQSEEKFGDVPLAELEGMADEIAGYAVTLSGRLRYPLMAAFRQALEAGIRYGYLTRNPAKLAGPNPMPAPREIRIYAPDELKAIVGELAPLEAAAVRFAAATGLRPAEWAAVERRDVDKSRRIVFVRGTKTHKSRREVPLTSTAVDALDSVPPRIDSRFVFTTSRKCPGSNERGPFDLANFRRRVWAPAIDAAGIAKPARIYDLRSTFISNALASGLTVFETARVAGTSVKMIEAHYGALALVFVLGGALELAGIYLVGRDVLDAHIANTTPVTPAQVKTSLGGKMWNKYTAAAATNKAVGGNIRRRAWGVALFALGVVVQTVGNIAALWII